MSSATRWWHRRRLMCPEVARVLQQYLDGELADHKAAQIRAHLRACRRCGLKAELYTEVKAALRRRAEPLSPDSIERLRAFAEGLLGEPTDPPQTGDTS